MRFRSTLLLALSACATVVPTTYPGDRVMWDGIFSRAEGVRFDVVPVAAVAPHHLVDAHELAGFWSELARTVPKPSRIILIAPDHFYAGPAPLSMASADVSWSTVYGTLASSPLELSGVPRGAGYLVKEHSVHVHATYVQRFFPGVPFTAITAQWKTSRAQLDALVKQLPADALVVASVDFSHYQPEPWATFHDASAYSTVSGFDFEGLFGREVDSPESLYVAMRFAQLRGAQTSRRWFHTNSQRRRVPFIDDSTSHQFFTFSPGPVVPQPSVSVILTGGGSGLTHHAGWTWRPDGASGAPGAPILAKLRGQEDRFFMGPELAFFDFAPGEREVRVRANGMELVVVDADLTAPPLEPPASGTCVVAVVKRGGLEPSEAERRAREWLRGAHVVLGRGFGAAREVEWEAHVLALSLGDWSAPGTAGEVVGVTCTREGVRLARLPIRIGAEGPTLDLESLERAR